MQKYSFYFFCITLRNQLPLRRIAANNLPLSGNKEPLFRNNMPLFRNNITLSEKTVKCQKTHEKE